MPIPRIQQRTKSPAPLVVNKADETEEAELLIYDTIDSYWGISAKQVVDALAGVDESYTLKVRFNSPGGDVFEGRAIYTALKSFKGKTIAQIDSVAASAATTAALGCDEIHMSKGSWFMIHNSWTFTAGNKAELRETANLLEKMDEAIVKDYVDKSGKSPDEIRQKMDDETWFTPEEAKAFGLIDVILDESSDDDEEIENQFDLGMYKNTPKSLIEPKKPDPAPDFNAVRAFNEARLRLLSIT